jgi:hypothetical protein
VDLSFTWLRNAGIRCTYAHGPHELAKYSSPKYEHGPDSDNVSPTFRDERAGTTETAGFSRNSKSAEEDARGGARADSKAVLTAASTRNVAPPGLGRPPGLASAPSAASVLSTASRQGRAAAEEKPDNRPIVTFAETSSSAPHVDAAEGAQEDVPMSPELTKALGLGGAIVDQRTLAMGPARPGPAALKERHSKSKVPEATLGKAPTVSRPASEKNSVVEAESKSSHRQPSHEEEVAEYESQVQDFILQDGRIDIRRMPPSLLAKHLNRQFSNAKQAAIDAGVDASIANAASNKLQEYVLKGGKLAGITSTQRGGAPSAGKGAKSGVATTLSPALKASLANTVTAGKVWSAVVGGTSKPGSVSASAPGPKSEDSATIIHAQATPAAPASGHLEAPGRADSLGLSSHHEEHNFDESMKHFLDSVENDDDYAHAASPGLVADGGDTDALLRSLDALTADPAYQFALSTIANALNGAGVAPAEEPVLVAPASHLYTHVPPTNASIHPLGSSPVGLPSFPSVGAPSFSPGPLPTQYSSLAASALGMLNSQQSAALLSSQLLGMQGMGLPQAFVMMPNGQLSPAYSDAGNLSAWGHPAVYPASFGPHTGMMPGGINIIPYPAAGQYSGMGSAGVFAMPPPVAAPVHVPQPHLDRLEDDDEMTQRVALWGIDDHDSLGVSGESNLLGRLGPSSGSAPSYAPAAGRTGMVGQSFGGLGSLNNNHFGGLPR